MLFSFEGDAEPTPPEGLVTVGGLTIRWRRRWHGDAGGGRDGVFYGWGECEQSDAGGLSLPDTGAGGG